MILTASCLTINKTHKSNVVEHWYISQRFSILKFLSNQLQFVNSIQAISQIPVWNNHIHIEVANGSPYQEHYAREQTSCLHNYFVKLKDMFNIYSELQPLNLKILYIVLYFAT